MEYGNPVELPTNKQSMDIEFTYSVEWTPTDITFEDRFQRLLETDFFEHKVQQKG